MTKLLKLTLAAAFLVLSTVSRAQDREVATYSDGVITVYSSRTALNAVVLYSAIYKSITIPGQETQFGMKVIKDWGNIEPWRNDYFYYISDRMGPIIERKFY